MIKLDIVRAVSEAANISQVRAGIAVNQIHAVIRESIVEGQRLEIRGFGVFFARPLKRGIGRNPRTGQITPIPRDRRTVRFKPGKDLQNLPYDPSPK
jgi:DNA-binding protein HU-beta